VTIIRLATVKAIFACLVSLFVLLALSPAATKSVRIYVTNYADTTVDVIDPVTKKIVQVIDGIPNPHGIALSPDGKRVYVTSEVAHVLAVVDQETGKILKKVPLSGMPNNIAVTKDGGQVLVCIRSEPGALDIVDAISLERVKSIRTKNGLHNVLVTPDGKYAVASSPAGHSLVVIDLQTGQLSWDVKFDQETRMLAMESGPDGPVRRVFVQLAYVHGFAVVDFATHREVARINLPAEPKGFEGEATASGPTHGIGVNPDGKTLWITTASNRCVFVYSLPDLKPLGYVPTGVHPAWLSFSPDGKMVYVSNTIEDGTLSLIDAESMKELARIPVGHKPMRTTSLELP
jgi:YVTN family beta-propeller protein